MVISVHNAIRMISGDHYDGVRPAISWTFALKTVVTAATIVFVVPVTFS